MTAPVIDTPRTAVDPSIDALNASYAAPAHVRPRAPRSRPGTYEPAPGVAKFTVGELVVFTAFAALAVGLVTLLVLAA